MKAMKIVAALFFIGVIFLTPQGRHLIWKFLEGLATAGSVR